LSTDFYKHFNKGFTMSNGVINRKTTRLRAARSERPDLPWKSGQAPSLSTLPVFQKNAWRRLPAPGKTRDRRIGRDRLLSGRFSEGKPEDILPGWITGEPAPIYPFFLFKKFLDGPNTGKAGNSQKHGKIQIGNDAGRRDEAQSGYQKKRPNTLAEIVFPFYHHRMKKPDNDQRCYPGK
jgi:hypothetical protein